MSGVWLSISQTNEENNMGSQYGENLVDATGPTGDNYCVSAKP